MSSSSFSNVKICFFLCFIEATWKFNTLACWLVKTSHWRLFLGLVKCIFYYILTHLFSLDLPWLYLSSFHRLSLHHSGSSILHLTEAKSHWITNNTHTYSTHTELNQRTTFDLCPSLWCKASFCQWEESWRKSHKCCTKRRYHWIKIKKYLTLVILPFTLYKKAHEEWF